MNWLLIGEIAYVIILVLVCLRIIYDTRSTTKTLAYLLFAVFVPIFGMIFYFSFGINYRHRKMYSKKLYENDDLAARFQQRILNYSEQTFQQNHAAIISNKELAFMVLKDSMSPLTAKNSVKLLINGEQKFPELLHVIKNARHHIHIEYYIYEDDEIGRAIEALLIEKAKEGVTIRFIYDDFGSRDIRKKLVPRLKAAGINAFPFLKVHFMLFANRLNYRNHRKIIVIDGITAFVGGINVSDRYINDGRNPKQVYWRDTHLRIDGPGTQYLQYLFLCDWNFCASEVLQPDSNFFPTAPLQNGTDNKIVQIAASGPDSESPTILFSILQAINLATEEILITSPYFIPGESLLDALTIASLSGITVKLLVPGKSDSVLVNAAARSYYNDLLNAGVEIYQYQKGFVHAKTMVTDKKIAIVGTANMDFRSFDLNFEVNAIVYDIEIASELTAAFYEDLKDARKIDPEQWADRPFYKQLIEKAARLLSPLL
ncbi:cardiolipin synthase [Pedobacter heparinus]|uniref:Cardiolipin synthase n=1 Tax=Pedobacter heparinus (strain ATCC 13125 / DSM 2366 / CIP 104194 / JCM 7457 / NBRC 12017 / NCIMB 9290 / NRRL B-14731 / HIM 762-3) TaxID=485917 RepID=C6XT94_PEDHD|nr:cardiolipin synthase [Pedobacter heparinus]ACU03655.1 phospholipase D/Transphosphatidylase [Pedobacter heparinus DSM 2366]